jgi:UDP-2,4-diacetamido-2,4,6-trideoxy-beta-L-altropyranose hydrolase
VKKKLPIVAFRVDASIRIGTGHVMRCLVLADQIRVDGGSAVFVCRAHNGHLAKQIISAGYEVILLETNTSKLKTTLNSTAGMYDDWLGASWTEDAEQTIAVLKEIKPTWLVVDHYAIDSKWERRLKQACEVKIMVIDGLANRRHDCDMLLDQSYSKAKEGRWTDLVPSACRLIVGPQYALLRPEFAMARKTLKRTDDSIKRIFVSFGGVDESNATETALDAIYEYKKCGLTVDVIVGATNPNISELKAKIKLENQEHVRLHIQPPNVAELMAGADLAISSGGTLLLEQCYLLLPSIVLSIADNQCGPARALHELGAVIYAGDFNLHNKNISKDTIRQHIQDLMKNKTKLNQMREVSRKLMFAPEISIKNCLQS